MLGELDVFVCTRLAQQAADGAPPAGTGGDRHQWQNHGCQPNRAPLLRGAGFDVALAGNVGPTLLEVLQPCLDEARWPRVWVLELSSFQLAIAQPLSATAAVWLNFTEDHLDWHGDMQAYAQAKQRVFGPGTERILCRDDAWLRQHFLPPDHRASNRAPPWPSRAVVSFWHRPAHAPRRLGHGQPPRHAVDGARPPRGRPPSRGHAVATPDACCRAQNSRFTQRQQRVGGIGVGHPGGCTAGAYAARAA